MKETFPIRDVWTLPTFRLARRVVVFHEVDSTNSRAAELASDPRSEGLAFLADRQSAGRGQYGRSWLAPPRSSVLLSLLLHPPAELSRPAMLTGWVAVSVCAVVQALTGKQPRIKWPNDVLVDDKKICGILIEQVAQGARSATVVGVGLNVTQTADDFARGDLPLATSLAAVTGRAFDTDEVARALIGGLDGEYDQLCQGERATLQTRWAEYLALVGREVVIECTGTQYQGRLIEATFDRLTLTRPGGGSITLAPEVVLHVAQV